MRAESNAGALGHRLDSGGCGVIIVYGVCPPYCNEIIRLQSNRENPRGLVTLPLLSPAHCTLPYVCKSTANQHEILSNVLILSWSGLTPPHTGSLPNLWIKRSTTNLYRGRKTQHARYAPFFCASDTEVVALGSVRIDASCQRKSSEGTARITRENTSPLKHIHFSCVQVEVMVRYTAREQKNRQENE